MCTKPEAEQTQKTRWTGLRGIIELLTTGYTDYVRRTKQQQSQHLSCICHYSHITMIATTQRLLLGACLFAGRSGAFHMPVVSSIAPRARLPGSDAGQGKSARSNSASLRRRVHSTGVVMAAATSGVMQETIEARLTEALSPVHLEVINESHKHSGPAKESHFKVRGQTEGQEDAGGYIGNMYSYPHRQALGDQLPHVTWQRVALLQAFRCCEITPPICKQRCFQKW